MKKFLVSTADVYGYDSNDNLLFVGKTLLDSSIETTLSNTDVRAGKGNQLQYIYYHTAEMNITINEAQFSLEFLALNTGSSIETGANIWTEETVTVSNGAGVVTKGTPLAIQTQTIYGWVTKEDGTVERVAFTGANFTLADSSYNGTVCVRYYTNDAAARKVTVYADMLPSTIRLVMVGTLASSDSTTNQIGTVQIEVPRASMTGAFTLSMTPDAVAQTPLSVRALASTETAGGCDGNRPIYATITEKINGAKWYDNVIALAIKGGDFDLKSGDSKTLQVYAIKNDGSAAFLAPVGGLTFASSETSKATVEGGIVAGVAAGSSTIKATITEVPEIDANVVVTVTE
ncbi:MAG: hypothetical protein ACI4OP_01945 [Candidatus Coprovivens sp.]